MAPRVLMTSFHFKTKCGTPMVLDLYHQSDMDDFARQVLRFLEGAFSESGDITHTIGESSVVPRPPRDMHVWIANQDPEQRFSHFSAAVQYWEGYLGPHGKKAFNVYDNVGT